MLRSCGLLGLAAVAASLAFTPGALAQSRSGWVDPPAPGSAAATPPAPSVGAQVPPAATPAVAAVRPDPAPDRTGSAPPAAAPPATADSPDGARERRLAEEETARSAESVRPAAKAKSRLQARRARAAAARLALSERRRPLVRSRLRARPILAARARAVQRHRVARRGPAVRLRGMRTAFPPGLQVMRLRTIEFPDGRRIRILTRPDPGALRALLDD